MTPAEHLELAVLRAAHKPARDAQERAMLLDVAAEIRRSAEEQERLSALSA